MTAEEFLDAAIAAKMDDAAIYMIATRILAKANATGQNPDGISAEDVIYYANQQVQLRLLAERSGHAGPPPVYPY